MLTQTWAILIDGYRELNAKKLFWIVLALSILIVVAFAGIGMHDGKITLFSLRTGFAPPVGLADFYKLLFIEFGIKFWLTFIAAILALISTASIFPDFLTGGSIDLYLSKPLGRLRLFLTKYASGLLFAGMQVLAFCLASFLVIGLRAGSWDWRIFIAVPVVVCFFSYLFSISAFFGVVTRSTVAAVLLTILAWLLIWGVDQAEYLVLLFKTSQERQLVDNQRQLASVRERIARAETAATTRPFGGSEGIAALHASEVNLESQIRNSAAVNLRLAHRILLFVKTDFPKTRETTDLLNRWMVKHPREQAVKEPRDAPPGLVTPADARAVEQYIQARSVSWIVGTSLVFEAAVLALAAWLFVRRDY